MRSPYPKVSIKTFSVRDYDIEYLEKVGLIRGHGNRSLALRQVIEEHKVLTEGRRPEQMMAHKEQPHA